MNAVIPRWPDRAADLAIREVYKPAAGAALGLLVVPIGIATTMILTFLPTVLRASHAALGALIWVAMVYLVWTATPARARSI